MPSPTWPNTQSRASGARSATTWRARATASSSTVPGRVTSYLWGGPRRVIAGFCSSRRRQSAARPTASSASAVGPRSPAAARNAASRSAAPGAPGHLQQEGDGGLGSEDRVETGEGHPVGQHHLGRLQVGQAPPSLTDEDDGGPQVVQPHESDRGVLGRGDQPEADGGDHTERALGPAEEAGQVEAGVVLHQAAEVADHVPGAEHRLDAEQVATRHAVAKDVVAAGVGGDRAADRGRVPRAEVHRVAPARRPSGLLHRGQRGPGTGGDLTGVAVDVRRPPCGWWRGPARRRGARRRRRARCCHPGGRWPSGFAGTRRRRPRPPRRSPGGPGRRPDRGSGRCCPPRGRAGCRGR